MGNDTISVTSDPKLGWVNQPNERGTIDVIWACLLVLVTCTWTVVHVNLPAPDESYWSTFVRKARWAAFALYAPEAITLAAACQRQSALESVALMQDLGVTHWTVVHGFFCDSGGFILRPPDTPPFPINTRALHYLIKEKYLEAPLLEKKDICDRSKADRFAKAFACVQSAYMICQSIARPIQQLDLSCLELVTDAFVMCTAVSYYFWMDKPLGVESAVPLSMATPMATVLKNAGDLAKDVYANTPMDFVEQPGWSVWKRRRWFRRFGGLAARPIQRIPNDFVEPPFTLKLAIPLWLTTVLYAAIHVSGWNYDFPTVVEQYIWRCASLVLLVVLFAWGIVEVLSVKPGFNFTLTLLGIWEKRSTKDTCFRRWAVDLPATVSALTYFVARTILVGEALASLRLMPSTVYQTVNWTNFWPHV